MNGTQLSGYLPAEDEIIDVTGKDSNVFRLLIRRHIYSIEDRGGRELGAITLVCGIQGIL